MYSPEIIARREHQLKKQGVLVVRRSRNDCLEVASKLENLRKGKDEKLLPNGQLARPLNKEEQAHIDSERMLCKIDFPYFFTRYYNIRIDPGVGNSNSESDLKVGPPPDLLPSQVKYIELIGKREVECYQEKAKYKFTVGIHAYFHKVRQVAATTTAGGMKLHRLLFWSGTAAFCASLDEPRVGTLFTRDHLAIDSLPWWLKPTIYPDVKDTEIGFDGMNTRCVYQAENQQQGRGGLGVGDQWDISHLTEVALWQNPEYIEFSFWPSVPKAISTLHIQESTANGKNYWHKVTEAARHKKAGFEHWVYAFIPWYMNATKYRAIVPQDWIPQEHSLRHAELVARTSPEWMNGVTVHLSKEQLYWWESQRAAYVQKDNLRSFLTNYPATPEQSFQNPSQGALPIELLEKMETRIRKPEMSYDVDVLNAGQAA